MNEKALSQNEQKPASSCKKKIFVIDTETTGLDPSGNELLQVSVIDSNQNILFDSYFKPTVNSWAEAEKVNGISYEMVKNSPSVSERVEKINEILKQADVIMGYNVYFDLDFLKANGITVSKEIEIIDVMDLFAEIYEEWSDYYQGYKWQSLETATRYYDYDWNCRSEQAHNSLADCFATLYVYNQIIQKENV